MPLLQLFLLGLIYIIPINTYSIEVIASTYEQHAAPMRSVELLRIFSCKQEYWASGNRITVFIKPLRSLEHREFFSSVLGSSILLARTTDMSCLHVVTSDDDMVYNISNIPFAIGYINNRVKDNEYLTISIIPVLH